MSEPKVQSVAELAVQVAKDPDLQAKIKANPAEAIAGLAAPLQSDVWIYRFVVLALGLCLLIALLGAIYLSAQGKTLPDILIGLGSGAIGALAGLLAPSPINAGRR